MDDYGRDDLDPSRAIFYGLLFSAPFWMLALMFPFSAHSQPRAELLAGQCQQQTVGSGVWYLDSYPHELSMTSDCGLLAASFPLAKRESYDLGLRVAYVQLGTISVTSSFPMRDDQQASKPSGANCDPTNNLSGCVGHGVGQQSAQGISVGATAEHTVGSWTFGAEAGGFLYYSVFSTVINASPAGEAFVPMQLNWGGLQISPYLGVHVRHGWAMVMLRDYGSIRAAEHGCQGCSGFAKGHAMQALAGLSVPF